MKKACAVVSRNPGEVTLIAVSKTKPVSMLQEAYDAGARVFGENKVQEIMDKYDQLPSDVQWHMIGHLQRNKVKYIIDKVSHDPLSRFPASGPRLLSRRLPKMDLIMPVLLEVNVAEEESKFGIHKEETLSLIRQIAALPHIQILGLMTIAPFVENPETTALTSGRFANYLLTLTQKTLIMLI